MKNCDDPISFSSKLRALLALNADGVPVTSAPPVVAELLLSIDEKIRPIALSESPEVTVFILFSLRQARSPGRRTDFNGFWRIGGLALKKDGTRPEHGCLELRSKLTKEPPDKVKFAGVDQVLRTDGRTWQAWVRSDHYAAWLMRESFTLTPSSNNQADKATVHDFGDFLRKGLLSWENRCQSEVLARYLAYYARESVDRLIREPLDRLEAFTDTLRRAVGVFVDSRLMAARLLVSLNVFERMNTVMWPERVVRLEMPPELDRWLQMSELVPTLWEHWETDLANTVQTLSETERPSVSMEAKNDAHRLDARLLDFCLTFWRELTETSSQGGSAGPGHQGQVERQIDDFLAMAPSPSKDGVAMADLNAGFGDYPLAFLHRNGKVAESIFLTACEAHPLGWMITRLRMEMAARYCKAKNQRPRFRVCWRNMFRSAPPEDFDPDIVLGETRPHIGQDVRLAVGHGHDEIAASGWGAKIVHRDLAATYGLFAAVHAFRERGNRVAISLRMPVSWADEEEHAAAREGLSREFKNLYINAEAAGPRPKDKRIPRGDMILVVLPRAVATDILPSGYGKIAPRPESRHSFLAASAYFDWPSLKELALREPMNGPVERRGMALVDMDRDKLEARMRAYFSELPDAELARRYPALMRNATGFDAAAVRKQLRAQTHYHPERMERFSFRPLDDRYLCRFGMRPLFSDPSNELFFLVGDDNSFLVASDGQAKPDGGTPAWWGRLPCDYDFFAGRSGHFPVWVYETKIPRRRRATLSRAELNSFKRVANLSDTVRNCLKRLGYPSPDRNPEIAELIWHHALAVIHTPDYQKENREALRHGWPRIQLPGFRDDMPKKEARALLDASARHGKKIAELLSGTNILDPDPFREVAVLTVDGCPTTPEDAAGMDPELLSITAGWGAKADRKGRNLVRAQEGKIMLRPYNPAEITDLKQAAQNHGLTEHQWTKSLGIQSAAVYLNDRTCWTGIPEKVWNYAIGGRQPLSKWLSYRERSLLNRPLTPEECRHFADTVRRITLLGLLAHPLNTAWTSLK